MTLETKRLALILGQVQLPAVVIGAFMFDLRGAPATSVIAASMGIAAVAGITAWLISLFVKCPQCDGRYYSIVPLFFLTSRRCAQCGLRDDHEGAVR